jgi:hypothetical protein
MFKKRRELVILVFGFFVLFFGSWGGEHSATPSQDPRLADGELRRWEGDRARAIRI